jgi:hypothetical protein
MRRDSGRDILAARVQRPRGAAVSRFPRGARTDAGATGAAVRRLRAAYAGADPATIAAGRAWYAVAEREARALARSAPPGVGRSGAAAVLAALSPRLRWAFNVADARAAVAAASRMADDPLFGDADGIGAAVAAACRYALGRNIDNAGRILAGEDPRGIVRGPKTRAFWRAICGDESAVTVDVWAALAAGYDPDRLTPKRHAIIDRAYRLAADWAGETPRDFQAIVWLAVRGEKPSDPQAINELSKGAK